MFRGDALRQLLTILAPISIASLFYLYLYPIFHGCAFPLPTTTANGQNSRPQSHHADSAFIATVRHHLGLSDSDTGSAPFRLLVLADPQLEGDSSLPTPEHKFSSRLKGHWNKIVSAGTLESRAVETGNALGDIFLRDLPALLQTSRKQLDLLGNDFYLAHIYKSLRWWSSPTHITVLGDLIGSQWVSDGEFERRSWRYWNRVFRGGKRVGDVTTRSGRENYVKDGGDEVIMDLEPDTWVNRIINIAGNHDIGYSGDIGAGRLERFDREFGRPNWDVRFQLSAGTNNSNIVNNDDIPSLRLIVLNSLLLDSPALDPSLQTRTLEYLNNVINDRSLPVENRKTFTLLLTHLPLFKQGICTDPLNFEFHEHDDQVSDDVEPRFKAGGLREQNHLGDYFSHVGILQGIFGMSGDSSVPGGGKGRNGLILTGHDHTGCDAVHYVDRTMSSDDGISPSWSWNAAKYKDFTRKRGKHSSHSIREVTLRSMMGEFGGNAGLLSVWFDSDPSVQEWRYEISTCQLGVQHIWWAVHVISIITLVVALVFVALPEHKIKRHSTASSAKKRAKPQKKKNRPAKGSSDRKVSGMKGNKG